MSEVEKEELIAIHEKLNRLFLIVEGEPKQGIEGLVPMLKRHMEESKQNFKTFKRDIALDYVNDINDLDKRLKPIEIAHKDRHRNLGIIGGVGMVLGFLASYLKDFFKYLTE